MSFKPSRVCVVIMKKQNIFYYEKVRKNINAGISYIIVCSGKQ